MVKKITKYQISFDASNIGKGNGVYYISFSNRNKALKEALKLKKKFPDVKWTIKKIKRNAWIKIK